MIKPNENIKIKGFNGVIAFGFDSSKKCEWIIFNKETGEVLDYASNMSGAFKKASQYSK